MIHDVGVTSGWIWDSNLLYETAPFEIRRLLNALLQFNVSGEICDPVSNKWVEI